MGIDSQAVHRPGPLKQSNKKHKSCSKSTARKSNKGKTDVKTISQSRTHELNRKDRKHQASQMRKNKRDAVIMKKRGLGASNAAPILVAVLPIDDAFSAVEFLKNLKNSDDDITANYTSCGHYHLSSPRLKQRFTFVVPKYHDLHAVLDSAKVADTLLFIHSQHEYSEYTEKLLSVILAHACPSTLHIIQGIQGLSPKKKSEVKKEILKKMESRFPDEKLLHMDTRQELQLLLRQIGVQKQKSVGFRDARSYLLSDKLDYECLDSDTMLGTLKVSGYVRGQPLNVNGLIHIPGWGDFQMCKIVYETDPQAVASKKNKAITSFMDATSEPVYYIDEARPDLQESLQSEITPDSLEGEQTWPTEDELNQAMQPEVISKKVVEGTSEYQAGWIVDSSDDEDSGSGSEIDCDEKSDESDSGSMITAIENLSEEEENMDVFSDCNEKVDERNPLEYDKDINMEEEKKMLVRFREERMEHQFPDERDTEFDVPARIRYQKYRGLKIFTSAQWDPMENLPLDYARIYRFENFKSTKKNVLKSDRDGAPPGSYVTIHVVNVPQSLHDGISSGQPFVFYGLLPHEQKMSVMNIVIKKHPSCKIPIKSKDSLIFHVGFRRFVCKPIFSAHHIGKKFKYERFLSNDSAMVASFYAPVTFPPASVAVLRQASDGQHELVATGTLMNTDPNRIIIKRIVLSGHMFKIFKKSAVVRYMFFNQDDINWFKKVELKTKYGIRGEIKEALGSHGHMKCKFQRQLPSQDVVLMSLYKRIFPKWTYETCVPTPLSVNEHMKKAMV